MADYTIEAQPRTVIGKKVRQLRTQGLVPVVVYGAKIDPVALQIPYRPLEVGLMKAGGTNLIDLTVNGGETYTVLARDVQRHVVRGEIMHVDFMAVDQNAVISADVSVHLVGESPIVASREGMILAGSSTLTIEALPSKLINSIEVDISGLNEIGAAIHVRDIDLGSDVRILNDPEEMIVRIAQPAAARMAAAEGEEEETMEGGSSEPEVIRRGREDEDEE